MTVANPPMVTGGGSSVPSDGPPNVPSARTLGPGDDQALSKPVGDGLYPSLGAVAAMASQLSALQSQVAGLSGGGGGGADVMSPALATYGNANVGFNNVFDNGSAGGGTAKTAQNSRDRYTVCGDTGVAQFLFTNYICRTVDFDIVCPNGFHLTAAVEFHDGRPNVPILFDGKRQLDVPGSDTGGGLVQKLCDPVALDLAAGDYCWVRTYLWVDTLGMVWPTYPGQTQNLGETLLLETAGTDRTLNTGTVGSTGFSHSPYKPLYAIAYDSPTVTRPTVLWGDSIMAGQQTFASMGLAAASVPFWNACRVGDAAQTHNGTDPTSLYRRETSRFAQNCVINYWRNDASSNLTLAQIQAKVVRVVQAAQRRGFNVVYVTPVPMLQPGDPLSARSADRLAFITWLKTLPAGITGLFDPAAIAATAAGDPDHWPAGWSTDGTHPNATGHAALQACVDPSLLVTA